MHPHHPLAGTRVAITRHAGSGGALARQVRALGGTPLLLPGSSLHAAPDQAQARAELRDALAAGVAIFTSPAAVRFARRLGPLHAAHKMLLQPLQDRAAQARAVRKSRKTAKKSRKTQNSAEKQLQKPSTILYN